MPGMFVHTVVPSTLSPSSGGSTLQPSQASSATRLIVTSRALPFGCGTQITQAQDMKEILMFWKMTQVKPGTKMHTIQLEDKNNGH